MASVFVGSRNFFGSRGSCELRLFLYNRVQMQLYTFILNFRGGTYISQFRGDDLVSVVRNWIEELDTTNIAHLGEDDLRLANENWDWDEDEITPN